MTATQDLVTSRELTVIESVQSRHWFIIPGNNVLRPKWTVPLATNRLGSSVVFVCAMYMKLAATAGLSSFRSCASIKSVKVQRSDRRGSYFTYDKLWTQVAEAEATGVADEEGSRAARRRYSVILQSHPQSRIFLVETRCSSPVVIAPVVSTYFLLAPVHPYLVKSESARTVKRYIGAGKRLYWGGRDPPP
ncbi:hypothetical protein B0H17DRAFT_1149805 [Mycena rosella]|uniref:Uncharacterized protein n=1 Tax=Mycena rosella TaxID=1033263 RepID=A0AAD7FN73_MYCRO|nr:hypothetical protein B0H17DRAFT_1149805 [Mycena rosella]